MSNVDNKYSKSDKINIAVGVIGILLAIFLGIMPEEVKIKAWPRMRDILEAIWPVVYVIASLYAFRVHWQERRELRTTIEETKDALKSKDAELRERDEKLSGKDSELREKDAKLSEKDADFKRKTAELIQAHKNECSELRQKAHDADTQRRLIESRVKDLEETARNRERYIAESEKFATVLQAVAQADSLLRRIGEVVKLDNRFGK